ncbi:LysE/ArgO family amino acid transporter [Psychrobacillus lasiicapitis]|uniref:Lysine transporter LysE n=1 Tax=Psychrobacillus lasiicapitis TaxID=1636719 RepID=A0A544T1J5_9BACI|nr:LysE family transporter [Psychrobacillus lasiicapitis]TQR11319.1 lysine transporter LysE [Psychrobacillus lasiicapitis]GGA41518.1 amino acid transporter [Psychrobacillus lasiicapitis]
MIWKGFQFGMFLQVAVGPICLFIFQTAAISGFVEAEIGVLGVAIVDGFYILAAIFGIGKILNKYPNLKEVVRYFGAAVLVLFGLSNIVGVFGFSIIPSLNFQAEQSVEAIFVQTLVLTLSNPLTILFWAGVLSTKILEEDFKQKDMYSFGLGAVLSTFFFLSIISILGNFLFIFLEPIVLKGLNVIVGLMLVTFGIRIAVK